MMTKVRILIMNFHIPGGPQTILGPLGCGPDVAVFDEVADTTTITLDERDERVPRLLSLFEELGMRGWFEWRYDCFTDAELAAACLILMYAPDLLDGIYAGPRVGTQYDMAEACKRCGTGARQTSAMVVDGERLQALEGKRVTTTWYNDILVDEKLALALAESGATGLSFQGVFAAFEKRGHFQLPWRQLCATHTLPPMSPRSTGLRPHESCSCRRSGFITSARFPTRLAYRAADVADIRDVNVTWEWFGEVKFNGDVYDSVLAYPLFLVTPKIWRIFRDAGATGFQWLPIRVVDE